MCCMGVQSIHEHENKLKKKKSPSLGVLVSRHRIILKVITGSSEFYFVEFDCPAAAVPLSAGSNYPESAASGIPT